MKKLIFLFISVILAFSLFACSSDGDRQNTESGSTEVEVVEHDTGYYNRAPDEAAEDNLTDAEIVGEDRSPEQETGTTEQVPDSPEQMIIYTADIHIRTKNLHETMEKITQQVVESGGYVAHSSTYLVGDNTRQGQLTVRVPQEKFSSFLQFVEGAGNEVLSREVTGQDVTEEYVDLESRLKSLRVQESRLLEFMEQAEKTEDLLKISEDLANVQEKIESLTGRMRYLENRVDMATITVRIDEKSVEISGWNEELNTWEKTVEQFKKSINLILQVFSFFIVFVIGNLPIFLLLGAIALITILIVRKLTKQKDNLPPKKE